MTYKCIVKGYDSGLNELLDAQLKRWDSRLKKLIVANPEKSKNDRLCEKYIRQQLKGVRIDNPIFVIYHFHCKDKKHDKTNIAYGFCKSFLDALQHCKVIKSDGWDYIENVRFTFEVNRNETPYVEVEIIECIKDKNSNSKDKEC